MRKMEILAPAGGMESLTAGVLCGADAVYLGGKGFNARRGAQNFDGDELAQAVSFCHVRGVKVYLALNTLVFDRELNGLLEAIEEACALGVDGLIVQDLAVAALVRKVAPTLPLHASTQMAVHNLDGVKKLEELGFVRAVLARELSAREIAAISAGSPMELECFVHGALCMSVSGQCYMSSMIGGRSGNRGLCAQPCRLPFAAGNSSHALSLKDLSLVEKLESIKEAGVVSLKIEGRMKRPEYVAAAVTACREALEGKRPDVESLRAVFSRTGFTSSYLDGKLGSEMFGVRDKEDVTAAQGVLSRLAGLYHKETGRVPLRFELTMAAGEPVTLTAQDGDGNSARAQGEPPQQARTAPTDLAKASAALEKTGGTPFFAEKIEAKLEDGLMAPVSQLNALRREVLEQITGLRGKTVPHAFQPQPIPPLGSAPSGGESALRVVVSRINQLVTAVWEKADQVIIPAELAAELSPQQLEGYSAKIMVALPRISFEGHERLRELLVRVKETGITHAWVGNLGSVRLAQELGFVLHGGYSLNITNRLSAGEYAAMGLADTEASFELELPAAKRLGSVLPVGILAYGRLPLMTTRNCPVGVNTGCAACGKSWKTITDRTGRQFPVDCEWGCSVIYNCLPLWLADRSQELEGFAFLTLVFTDESPRRCGEVLSDYRSGGAPQGEITRGLYYRRVL